MSTVILFEIVKGEGEDEGERDADIWKIESKQAGLYVFEPSTFISIYAFSFFFFFVCFQFCRRLSFILALALLYLRSRIVICTINKE